MTRGHRGIDSLRRLHRPNPMTSIIIYYATVLQYRQEISLNIEH